MTRDLTDEELATSRFVARTVVGGGEPSRYDLKQLALAHLDALEELGHLRAAPVISEEEREGLEAFVAKIRRLEADGLHIGGVEALAVLDRLLSAGKETL